MFNINRVESYPTTFAESRLLDVLAALSRFWRRNLIPLRTLLNWQAFR